MTLHQELMMHYFMMVMMQVIFLTLISSSRIHYQPTSNLSSDSDDDGKAVTLDDILHAYVPTTSPPDTGESLEDTFSQFLYPGAQVTLGVSVILIMSFVVDHGQTDAALRDLLHIISLHCPSSNLCVTSSRSALKLLNLTTNVTTIVLPVELVLTTYN